MDSYVEQILPGEVELKGKLALYGSCFLTGIGAIIMLFFHPPIGLLIVAVGAFLISMTKKMQDIEYEYLFVNGDCEISCIMSKASRKKRYAFNEGDVLRVMPYSSLKYQNDKEVKTDLKEIRLTSGEAEKESYWYVFYVTAKGGTDAVVLELNEKTLTQVQTYYRKKLEDM